MAKRAAAGISRNASKAVSRDTLLRQELDAKRTVCIDGETRRIATRQLVIQTTVKDALTGDREARRMIWEAMGRPLPAEADVPELPLYQRLNANDALTLEEFEAEVRRRIMAEVAGEAPDARR